jgi:hypothetical protein
MYTMRQAKHVCCKYTHVGLPKTRLCREICDCTCSSSRVRDGCEGQMDQVNSLQSVQYGTLPVCVWCSQVWLYLSSAGGILGC